MKTVKDFNDLSDLQKERVFAEWKAARKIAATIAPGHMRRVTVDGTPGNYWGSKRLDGSQWIIGDTLEQVPYPTAYVHNMPATRIK